MIANAIRAAVASVAVNDANGVWGTASKLFNAVASTEFTCSGLVSSPTAISPSTSKPHSQSPNRSAIIVAVVVSVSAILLLLILLFFLRRWWRRRSQVARQPGPALMPESWYNPIPLIEQESGVAGSPSTSVYDLQTSPSSKLAQLCETSGRSCYVARPGYRLNRRLGSVGPSSRTDDVNYSEGVNSSSLEVKSRLPPGVSPQWIIENDAVQHKDAEAAPIQEIPPPYIFAGPRPSMHSTSSLS